MAHTIVWVDMPVLDIDRACKFYSFLLGAELKKKQHDNTFYVPFPHEDGEVSGCLVEKAVQEAIGQGLLVYFNIGARMDEVLENIESHGGKILSPKEQIGPWGYRTKILDTEGNKIALHSY